MGRGRAPCCDKSQVIRGPWSPAEDLRLICYIQKYGHDNWRALPKQAGLLRCGKSCRLRWINYLRPDLKRGNFTAKEEETIIKLHESIGNKWSRIAAHFPGRTDNEIKNVWNTHLKKRLLAKKAAEYKEDVTKETSAITSASSSSSTTVELSHENHKIEIESQIKLLPSSDGSSEKTIFAPNKSIVANQVPQLLQDFESVNKVDSSIHQQSDQLFDSADINQLEEFTMWEDPNLLESLLSAVESHEWVLAPPDNQEDSTENNSSCELRMESGIDLWNMLNNDDQPAPAKPVEVPMSQKSMNAAHEYITDNDIDSMFEYLENDPGLARISMEMCQKPCQYQGGDLNHGSPATATGNVVNGSPFMDYFPIWPPQSPN